MGIRAESLTVGDFRSYRTYELGLARGVTVLVGPNAAGKTNLVEALQILTAAQSFRHPAPRELVRAGADAGFAELTLTGDGRRIDHRLEIRAGRRSFARNGKRCAAADIRGTLPSVLFCPDDLDMVKRSASVRRAALDGFGVQLSQRYADLASSYDRIVSQRNDLLRDPARDPISLEAWTDALCSTAAALTAHRLNLLARIRARFREVYAALSGGEEADVSYAPAVPIPVEVPADREAIRAALEAALAERAEEEVRRGLTLVGPHRDELAFSICGRAARAYGSQGQQRSVVLAWKIAEVEVTRDILGCAPLLLLDDVMSELDAARRAAVVRFVEDGIQAVITTANLGYFTEDLLEAAKVVRIDGA